MGCQPQLSSAGWSLVADFANRPETEVGAQTSVRIGETVVGEAVMDSGRKHHFQVHPPAPLQTPCAADVTAALVDSCVGGGPGPGLREALYEAMMAEAPNQLEFARPRAKEQQPAKPVAKPLNTHAKTFERRERSGLLLGLGFPLSGAPMPTDGPGSWQDTVVSLALPDFNQTTTTATSVRRPDFNQTTSTAVSLRRFQ